MRYFAGTYQQKDIDSQVAINVNFKEDEDIPLITPKEDTVAIDELNVKKASGIDRITVIIIQELPKNAIVLLVIISNAILRLKYVPDS